jgi:hypothetical protein
MTMRDDDHDLLAARGAALVAQAVARTSAPLPLRTRIAEQRLAAARPVPVRHVTLLRGLAGATAAAVAAAALLLPGGSPGAPSISEAAQLGLRPAEVHAHLAPGDSSTVRTSVEGIAFPSWTGQGWTPTGARADTLHGRRAKTVFYDAPDGTRVAYTIVGGHALDGTPTAPFAVRTDHRDGRWLVTWQRDGHTCVLTASDRFAVQRLQARALDTY